MKQKIVIKVSMSCEKSRSKAMAMAARTTGVISMGITGDGRDRLEVVGDGVDSVCLVSYLRKKLGHAQILQMEEVKEKKPDAPKPLAVVHPQPQCYPSYYYHHYPPAPQMVICDERPSTCSIM